MTALSWPPAPPSTASKLAEACERIRVDTLTARRVLRWAAELPRHEREALFLAVQKPDRRHRT